MEAIIQYIYTGETYITKDDLPSFLNTANLLQIIGLINNNLNDHSDYPFQNGLFGHKTNDLINHTKVRGNSSSNAKPNLVVKKFANKFEEGLPLKKPKSPVEGTQIKKRNSSSNSDGEAVTESPVKPPEESCPILSKQLLLPKKRKLSVVDQNKNEFYDNSELSNSGGEEPKENATILRNFLEEKPDTELETDEEPGFPNVVSIKKEVVESENVLEPEVDLCVKEENEFESASEESLHNGDILLQRLQAFQGKFFRLKCFSKVTPQSFARSSCSNFLFK